MGDRGGAGILNWLREGEARKNGSNIHYREKKLGARHKFFTKLYIYF
jgi:hypothetical protein